MQNNKSIRVIVLVAAVIFIGVIVSKHDFKKELTKEIGTKDSSIVAVSEMNNEEIKTELDDTLDVLMRIHYVSVIDKTPTSPESVIIDELTESMGDLNKLQRLLPQTKKLSKSKNEIISTTGLVLDVSTMQLIDAYNIWIQYLRGVDVNTVSLSEFQYQMALFQSSTHDVYLKLIENSSLLPMITVKFAKNDNEENSFDEDLKSHFLSKIDSLFGDILIADDAYHAETKNRYAVAVLIRQYEDFLTSQDK